MNSPFSPKMFFILLTSFIHHPPFSPRPPLVFIFFCRRNQFASFNLKFLTGGYRFAYVIKNNSTNNCERSYYFLMVITPNPLFRRVYLYVAHSQPRAAHGALHHITPGHWTSSFMSIDTSHIFSLPTVGIR